MIGDWFRLEGVHKITVSSLSSAAYFASDGWTDITVAFPVNLLEAEVINQLASKIRLGLLLEDSEVAMKLDSILKYPADAYIKIDTGYHRTGLISDNMPVILELAHLIQQSSHLTLRGLLTHAGHTYHAEGPSAIREIYSASTGILNLVRGNLGMMPEKVILSYGDTPSCTVLDNFPGIDEIRPGNFVFYDLMQVYAGVCDESQVAGIVVCPVVAIHPDRNQGVLYGGAIHFSKESILVDGRRIFGQLVEMDGYGWHRLIPGAFLVSLSQEHGILEAPEEVIKTMHPGQLVGIMPVHSCLTANLLRGYQLGDGKELDFFTGF